MPPLSTASATFGPTDCTPISSEEEVALLLGREAVERERVVAHDEVAVQRDRRADARARGAASRPRRRGGSRRRAVSTHDVVGAPDRDRAADECDHARIRRSRISTSSSPGSRIAGHDAAVRDGGRVRRAVEVADRDRERVGGVLGVRRHLERQQRLDHARDLVLLRAPGAADGVLDLLGRVGDDVQPALAGGEHDDAARLADGERAARRSCRSRCPPSRSTLHEVLVEQLADATVDRGEADLRRGFRAGRDDAAVEREQAPAAALDDAVAGVGGAGVDAEDDHQ